VRYHEPSQQCKNLYRFIRLVLGDEISDREIARRWGMDEKNLRELKRGLHVVPKLSRLEALAEVLGVHRYYVLEAASGIPAERVYRVMMQGLLEYPLREMERAFGGMLGDEGDRIRILTALQRAVLEAYRTLDPEELFVRVSRELKKFKFESHIFYLDQESGWATIRHSSFPPRLLRTAETITGLSLRQFRFPVKRVPTFRTVLEARWPVYLPDASVLLYEILGERQLRRFAVRMKRIFKILEVVLIPVTAHGKVAGILATGRGGKLSEAYLPEMRSFSEELSRSLENALLFRQLKDSEAHLRSLFDNLPEGVFECDGGGRLLHINPAGAEVLGLSDPREGIGKSIDDFQLLAPNARVVRKQVRTSRESIVQNIMGVALKANGTPFLVDVTFRTRFDHGGTPAWTEGVFRDISQRGS